MKGLYARDKDSIVACMLICEMAAYYSLRGMTLIDAMDSLYAKYGYYTEDSAEIYKEGLEGKAAIAGMMNSLRENIPTALGGEKVINFRDYQAETSLNVVTGKVESTGLPKSNVLYYMTESGNVVVARPSGTEPKIKFYILAKGDDKDGSKANAASCKASLEACLGLEPGELRK